MFLLRLIPVSSTCHSHLLVLHAMPYQSMMPDTRQGSRPVSFAPRDGPLAHVVACTATLVLRSTTVVARRGKGKTHASRTVFDGELLCQQVVEKEGGGTAGPPRRQMLTVELPPWGAGRV